MSQLYFNGQFLDAQTPLFNAQSRAVKYGDGCFESIAFFNGVAPLLEGHIVRLIKSAQLLKLELPAHFSLVNLSSILAVLAERNQLKNARIRIQISRKGEGLYLPKSNESDVVITMQESNHSRFIHSEKTAVFYPELVAVHKFSALKTTAALGYVMASLHAEESGAGECILVNQFSRIAESNTSNVFIVKRAEIITPPLLEGGIDGVMRRYLFQLFMENNISVVEKNISKEDLLNSEEIFLTNAVKGIQSISLLEGKIFTSIKAQEFTKLLNLSLVLD